MTGEGLADRLAETLANKMIACGDASGGVDEVLDYLESLWEHAQPRLLPQAPSDVYEAFDRDAVELIVRMTLGRLRSKTN